MDQSITISEILGALRRRLPLLILVGVIGLGVSVWFAMRQPSIYRTSTRVLVERQQIPDELARSTVNLTTSQRLQLVEERLMARDNLVRVIDRLGVFANTPVTLERKVELVRAATLIESISGVNPGQSWGVDAGIFAFTITVELGDPRMAAQLANEFAAGAVAQNALVRTERARDTLQYFEREVETLVGRIVALETEIATFKTGNEAALPDSLEYRRQELARIQLNQFELASRITDLQNEQSVLSVEAASGIGALATQASVAETELRQLESELAQRRRVLGGGHPEIRQLAGRIDALKELVASTESVEDPAAPSASPMSQRDALRRRIDQITTQIEFLEEQGAELAARREALDVSILGTPEVEAKLAAYTRNLVELQEQHSVAARRLAEAQTGEQLEVNLQAERFQVVEAAPVPTQAVGPKRKKLVIIGGGLSMMIGIGLAGLLEVMRPVIRSSVQMERQLGIRPVVSIPRVTTKWDRRSRRLRWVGACLLMTGLAAAASPLAVRLASPTGVEGASATLEQALSRFGFGS